MNLLLLLVLLFVGCASNEEVAEINDVVKADLPEVKRNPFPAKDYGPPAELKIKLSGLEEPECMKPAVDFWEQVYTSTGTEMVIFNKKTYEIYHIDYDISWKNRKAEARKLIYQVAKQEGISTDKLQAQVGAAKSFSYGMDQAKELVPIIQERLREEGMPEELAFIPMVESSFNMRARSRVGALGPWQIMPRTFRLYASGKTSQLYNLEFATDVAIKILRHNYELLESWPLAVNAYHSGPGRLMKARDALGTDNICTITKEFNGKGYKHASRNYFAQFLAAKRIYLKETAPKLQVPKNGGMSLVARSKK